ncbi:MAG: universal stress protein [Pirellulaceae bacterium]
MHRFKRILLYADPVTDITPALRYAARLAIDNAGIVTVVDCSGGPDVETRLRDIADQLQAQGVPVKTKALSGNPADEITREAIRSSQDIVFKTAQGDGVRKERAFFGTTAIRLMRICPCAVCVVDPREDERFDRIVAAVDPANTTPEHQGLDEKILEVAVSLAQCSGGTLDVIHAWSAFGESLMSSRLPADELSLYVEAGRIKAQLCLADLLSRFATRLPADRVHLYHGELNVALATFVTQHQSDLVIMGSVGRTGLQSMLMGNAAEGIVQQVRCSVLVLKTDKFVCPVKLDNGRAAGTWSMSGPYPGFTESSSAQGENQVPGASS